MPRQLVRGPVPEPPPKNKRAPVPPPVARPSAAALATRALIRQGLEARDDLEKFYALVIRHETTRAALVPSPHQRLAFSFIKFHDRVVLRQPVGTGKTFLTVAHALHRIGNDVSQRGAIVSKATSLSQKPLGLIASYITEPVLSKRLALVFPELQRSTRAIDSWTQTKITVERPPGARDPSVIAAGLETKVAGSRWDWLVADDTIDVENTTSPEQREKCNSDFDFLVSRLEPVTPSHGLVTNTPWHREDLTYHLEQKAGWPTLSMDVYGFVWFSNVDAAWLAHAEREHIRPSATQPGRWRLRAYDPDPEEKAPLWPARYPLKRIEELRHGKTGSGGMLPQEFARLLLCEPFAQGAARCQRAWVEACKVRGAGMTLVSRYDGPLPVFCGVDLALGKREVRTSAGRAHDKTVFFTFALMPDKSRLLLSIESGRWSGLDIINKIADHYARYRCRFAVENVSGQDFLRQWALETRRDILITPHTTGATNKHHLAFGVESVFAEVQQTAWIIPCDRGTGHVDPEVQVWIDQMLYYQPPPAHTGDALIACWVARELARGAVGGDPRMSHRTKLEMASNVGGF